MHGREILTSIKKIEKYRSIPLVVLTTSSSKEDRAFCQRHGANEFIAKPSTVEGFVEAVKLIVSVVPNK
jgi:CheY-like chemotaxis protein